MKNFLYLCLITFFLSNVLFFNTALHSDHHGSDTKSGASVYTNKPLPKKGKDYKVLGYIKGLKNFVIKYDEKLIRGGDVLNEKGIKALKKFGITTIFSISPTNTERSLAKQYGIDLKEIEFLNQKPIPLNILHMFIKECKDSSKKIYLHCHGGTHRAGALGVAYRMHVLKWNARRAIKEFAKLGGNLKSDGIIIESVKRYKM